MPVFVRQRAGGAVSADDRLADLRARRAARAAERAAFAARRCRGLAARHAAKLAYLAARAATGNEEVQPGAPEDPTPPDTPTRAA